jgi:hypothetical protein
LQRRTRGGCQARRSTSMVASTSWRDGVRRLGPARNGIEIIEGNSMERFSIAGFAPGRSTPGRSYLRRNALTQGPASGSAVAAASLAAVVLAFSSSAHASFLPPELMDSAAMYLAWFIIIFVPIGGIVLFWMVHVLPEKIAHKRHHPQRDAIQVLCLLSLVFGGLLWPIAWLWAYVKPVTYKMAYGTEKHDDYFREMSEKAKAGELLEHELEHLREELDAMDAKGALTAELKALRRELISATVPPGAVGAKAGAV